LRAEICEGFHGRGAERVLATPDSALRFGDKPVVGQDSLNSQSRCFDFLSRNRVDDLLIGLNLLLAALLRGTFFARQPEACPPTIADLEHGPSGVRYASGLAFYSRGGESNSNLVPVTMGAMRPTIFCPSPGAMGRRQADAVIAHETPRWHARCPDARISIWHRECLVHSAGRWLDRHLSISRTSRD